MFRHVSRCFRKRHFYKAFFLFHCIPICLSLFYTHFTLKLLFPTKSFKFKLIFSLLRLSYYKKIIYIYSHYII